MTESNGVMSFLFNFQNLKLLLNCLLGNIHFDRITKPTLRLKMCAQKNSNNEQHGMYLLKSCSHRIFAMGGGDSGCCHLFI